MTPCIAWRPARDSLAHAVAGGPGAGHAGRRLVLDAGVEDVVRPHTSEPGTFTYWDYQRLAFQKRRGMRIDFILASEALAHRVVGAAIDREERKGKGASDHAPVVVDLD